MQQQGSLILSLPQGVITATSFDLPELAAHRSPGHGKYFRGRSVLVDLAMKNGAPDFAFLDEGGWRDAGADARTALEAVEKGGKRTKTALSNNGFSATPISAYRRTYLSKTGGQVLQLDEGETLATYSTGPCDEGMSPDQVAKAAGLKVPASRHPRLFMIIGPIEALVLTNLTPVEYSWYATHRPGKIFRQVMFAELREDPTQLAAEQLYDEARRELTEKAGKKTKSIYFGDVLNQVTYHSWVGYDREAEGGLYVGDRNGVRLWRFPREIPRAWERAY